MRKIIYLFIFCLLVTGIPACTKDFLDKAPGTDITENTVFSTRNNLESFIVTVYKYGMHSLFRYGDQQYFSYTVPVVQYDAAGPTSAMCDEGDASEAGYYLTNEWNKGNVLPTNIVAIEDYRYYIRWIALRQINLILKRAGEVPEKDPSATQSYINQVTGEVKVLRAMNYLEMIKRYGGVPIVDQVFEAGVPIDVPRSSLDSCIKFIIRDCDDAIANPDLPASYPATFTGRVTKTVAYLVKAKTLLLAASPQFNTAVPSLSMPGESNNRLICLGNYDLNRWKLAADAAKAAIDYAESNGYSMIDVPANRNPSDTVVSGVNTGAPQIPAGNYRNSWDIFNNSEVILAYQGNAANNFSNDPIRLFLPTFAGTSRSGCTMPLNFLKKYEKKDGTPQSWPASGGNNLLAKYYELDPRFKQTLCYTRSYFNVSFPNVALYNGGTPANVYNNCFGGTWMRKFIPTVTGRINVNDVLYRLNELYLYYAEALNEYNAAPPAEAYAAVNKIRNRSDMPNLPTGLSQEQFRQRVRNESAIELIFEDHRMWDIRRWLIAEEDGVMNGAFEGLRINRVNERTYTWSTWSFETRLFTKKMYLHPFPQPEVLKGNLVQNPGY